MQVALSVGINNSKCPKWSLDILFVGAGSQRVRWNGIGCFAPRWLVGRLEYKLWVLFIGSYSVYDVSESRDQSATDSKAASTCRLFLVVSQYTNTMSGGFDLQTFLCWRSAFMGSAAPRRFSDELGNNVWQLRQAAIIIASSWEESKKSLGLFVSLLNV